MKPYKDWGAYAKAQYKLPSDLGDDRPKKTKPEVSVITKFGCGLSLVGILLGLGTGIVLAVDSLLSFIKDMHMIIKTGVITILVGTGVAFAGLIVDSIKRHRTTKDITND